MLRSIFHEVRRRSKRTNVVGCALGVTQSLTAQKRVKEKTGTASIPKSVVDLRNGTKVNASHIFCCPVRSLPPSARRNDGHWIHYPVRRDYVLYIENLANEELWPPVERDATRETSQRRIQSTNKRLPGQLYHPDTTIAVFDFASFEGLALRSKYPLNAYHDACWKYVNLEWQTRVMRMYRDVEESNGWSCFVEGIFLLNEKMCVFVLVKMAWDEDAVHGRRYKAEESVWRIG